MFFIWGNKPTTKIIGRTEKVVHCEHCGNDTPFQVRLSRDWFALYFLPVIPMTSNYRLECPICQYGREMDKKMADTVLESCITEV